MIYWSQNIRFGTVKLRRWQGMLGFKCHGCGHLAIIGTPRTPIGQKLKVNQDFLQTCLENKWYIILESFMSLWIREWFFNIYWSQNLRKIIKNLKRDQNHWILVESIPFINYGMIWYDMIYWSINIRFVTVKIQRLFVLKRNNEFHGWCD